MPQAFINPPTQCDICKNPITEIFYDAKTRMGPWAFMCPTCEDIYGCGRLGIGSGQRYEKNSKGYFVKTGG